MGREFDTLVTRCSWMKGRGLMLDFKINAARKRWATFWNKRPVGFENRVFSIKRFYKYPLIIESTYIDGVEARKTPMELKRMLKDILGDDWNGLTKNTHFFHDKETRKARGVILDFGKPGLREKWHRKLSRRDLKIPFTVRDFKWYTDDDSSEIARRQEQLAKPGGVASIHTPRLFVGNLNKTTSAVDLVIYFSNFGPVKDATIMANTKTGKSRGFGFVTFKDSKTVEKALSTYHRLMGRDLAIQKALNEEDIAIRGDAPEPLIKNFDPTPTTVLKVSPVPSGLSNQDLTDYFRNFGPVNKVEISGDNEEKLAHVFYASTNSVERAVMQVKHMVRNRPLNIDKEFIEVPETVLFADGDDVKRQLEAQKAQKSTTLVDAENTVSAAQEFMQDVNTMVKPLEKVTDPSTSASSAAPMDEIDKDLLIGDYGLDIFNTKEDQKMLRRMRLAEIKHSRLAMLAAAAWPLQELFDPAIANLLGVEPLVTLEGRNPSLINGGLQQVSPIFWATILGATIVLEILYGNRGMQGEIRIENAESLARGDTQRAVYKRVAPGELGFDPLNLYPGDPTNQRRIKEAELNNGRLAMIALSTFVAAEYITGESIVDLTPFFFKPLGQ
mmetsp:Transcript_2168/g.3053  ORF Transcript_2168/g.3053 Transcript_2168/m.3053 type:complete len:613 (-) Transcript_2168:128-1966(-)